MYKQSYERYKVFYYLLLDKIELRDDKVFQVFIFPLKAGSINIPEKGF